MLRITDRIPIDDDEIEEVFVRAGGPGGQDVNKGRHRGPAPLRRSTLAEPR